VGNSVGNELNKSNDYEKRSYLSILNKKIFDEWPEKYDQWFKTPLGSLIKRYEGELISDYLRPTPGENILDAGCGTGVFTADILSAGSHVVGLDLSLPMLRLAESKFTEYPFHAVLGNMTFLPFKDCSFDKVVSITALEFVPDAERTVHELFRVAKNGGIIVVATLNSLSSWAARRIEEGKRGHDIFSKAIFRSPNELRSFAKVKGNVRTAIHFQKGEDLNSAVNIERQGQVNRRDHGAFVAVRWQKP
jgi:ubiquinone/menaquinone biosynthesis C-methylase UbiE